MNTRFVPVHLAATGIVCAVGLHCAAAGAAIRAGISGVVETRFRAGAKSWIRGAVVPLDSVSGEAKLVEMAALAAGECVEALEPALRARCALVLCLADESRARRLGDIDAVLADELGRRLGVGGDDAGERAFFSGHVGVALALQESATLLASGRCERVLIVCVDSLLNRRDIARYADAGRLVTPANSNGFFPGEGAAALLVERTPSVGALARCLGIGLGVEPAPIGSGEVLQAQGLSAAVDAALAAAGRRFGEVDWRIADLSGEHYAFKEASLLVARRAREVASDLPLWHPAECVGEAGAAAGGIAVALCAQSFGIGRAAGGLALCHFSNDDGARAAIVLAGEADRHVQ